MAPSGYFDSPWPCEDAGPSRLQTPHSSTCLDLQTGMKLASTSKRTQMSTMTVLGAPGEVFLLTHSVVRSYLGLATSAQVSRIDPLTLETLECSPRLEGGPMWPGGMAVHANGYIIVVYGRYAHKLNRQCQTVASYELPVNEPYNSFVVLDNGLIVTKNLSETTPAQLTTLHPDSFKLASSDVACPEASIARLSAHGNTVYLVGVSCVFRYHWDKASQQLVRDPDWEFHYLQNSTQSYGWDMVIDGQHGWFMDNGKHNYFMSMLGAGIHPAANRLIRVSLTNAQSHQSWEVSGLHHGSITNPPLIDVKRRIVVGYDSANRHLRAWKIDTSQKCNEDGVELSPLWHHENLGAASHMLLFANTGEMCVNDYSRFNEQVLVLDIETGQEKARIRTEGFMQGVVFPSAGWHRDFYWCSMDRLARIYVSSV